MLFGWRITMAKKQTRRSVSIRGTTYEQVREYCERHGLSMSEFMEQRIALFFEGAAERPAPRTHEPRAVVPVTASLSSVEPVAAPVRVGPTGEALDDEQLHKAARDFIF
jgi:hypothetical protein